jgi:2-polyprenyl-3-methyl-5-hydroxy-6-metoxy-1,4-benzoquinol methylase
MKQGEKEYFKKIGIDGVRHAINKPFSDENCQKYFFHFGAIFSILPPPPKRLLDLGCGTGWTSEFFARRGYEVIGVDISEDAIEYARKYHSLKHTPEEDWLYKNIGKVEYIVSDYENLNFKEEFDCVVFYDSLHHAENEYLALFQAYKALKYGGVCITCEPGDFHSVSPASKKAVAMYNVEEKNMPARKIINMAKKIGFRRYEIYINPEIFLLIYDSNINFIKKLKRILKFIMQIPTINIQLPFFLQIIKLIK